MRARVGRRVVGPQLEVLGRRIGVDDLARVQAAVGIPDVLELAERADELGAVHLREQLGARLAVAVLARQRAAVSDDELDGVVEERAPRLDAPGAAQAEVDARVHVTDRVVVGDPGAPGLGPEMELATAEPELRRHQRFRSSCALPLIACVTISRAAGSPRSDDAKPLACSARMLGGSGGPWGWVSASMTSGRSAASACPRAAPTAWGSSTSCRRSPTQPSPPEGGAAVRPAVLGVGEAALALAVRIARPAAGRLAAQPRGAGPLAHRGLGRNRPGPAADRLEPHVVKRPARPPPLAGAMPRSESHHVLAYRETISEHDITSRGRQCRA